MKKLFTVTLFLLIYISSAFAQVEFEQIKNNRTEKLTVTGFFDYYPFGKYENNVYTGVFEPFLRDYARSAQYTVDWAPISTNYEDTVREMARHKEIDVLLGIYGDTSLYNDIKIIYPAAIDNPIHIVMLPEQINKIHTPSDLTNLKGAIHSKERFSDYINNKIKQLKIEYIDNSYDLYGKLIRGEIDYILTSIYFGTIETAKLGLRQQVAFSKQSLWTIPMFIGISKMSFHREYLSHTLTQLMSKKETPQRIKQDMIDLVNKAIKDYAGTVPPTYKTVEDIPNKIQNNQKEENK